jgi:hypothetical protein
MKVLFAADLHYELKPFDWLTGNAAGENVWQSFSCASHMVRAGLFFDFHFGGLLFRLIRFLNGTHILAP